MRELRQEHLLPYEMTAPNRSGISLPAPDVPPAPDLPPHLLRTDLSLPTLGELETIRYFSELAGMNYSIEDGMYPLGSCTMKYNPKVNDAIAALPGFTMTHPEQPVEQVQGNLQLMCELQQYATEITGMDAGVVTGMAGAHGELTGILMMSKYHEMRGELAKRRRILVPDTAHGTNPATAAMAGFEVTTIPSNNQGHVDLSSLAEALDEDVAGMMLTLPSTVGLFDPNILLIADMLHRHGALLYGDGANMNALVGRVRPGDLGVDVMHMNLHKTFSTPHGGGGPGAASITAKAFLAECLPTPVIAYDEEHGQYDFIEPAATIGRIGEALGNFGVLVRAHAYIRALGAEGLRAVSDNAVINANYLRVRLAENFEVAYNQTCMHEVILTLRALKKQRGVTALDLAKTLEEKGYHPPTIYFPKIIDEAVMIEPTESESKPGLDKFIDTMNEIAQLAEEDPDYLKNAPYSTPVRRVDEVKANRQPIFRWKAT